MDYRSEIDVALSNQDPISKDKVLLWIESPKDLPTLAKLYSLTDEGYYRIDPELGKIATCSLIQRYLLECIRQDVADSEEIEGRWEAAQSLHSWFRHLVEMNDTSEILNGATHAVTELFLISGEEIRIAIEQGFLEHALETAALRPYFEYWSTDARLRETWSRALKWGKAHPDFTWGLLQELRRKMEQE